MNRYDGLTWALGLLVDKDVREAAQQEVAALEVVVMRGEDKRRIIVSRLLPGIVHGGVYLARALVELWLGQLRERSRGG